MFKNRLRDAEYLKGRVHHVPEYISRLPVGEKVYVPGLDPGIEEAVLILREGGVETYESCEGGPGHSYCEPTIRFYGTRTEGFRAYDWAMKHGLPVMALRRIWMVVDDELTGPDWEMVFWKRNADG